MKEWIERLFNIRSGEWGDLMFFWVLNTLLCTGLAVGEAVAETLFLKRIGVDFLPFMFILCALVAIPVSLLLARIQGTVRQGSLTIGIHGVSLLLVAVSALLVEGNVLAFGRTLGTPVFYLVEVLLTIVLSTHFSVLVSNHFSTLTAKRLIPLILSGTVVGALAGGMILHFFAHRLGVTSLIWIWVALIATSLIWYLLFSRRVFAGALRMQEEELTPQYLTGTWLERLVYEVRAVGGSPILLMLAVSTLLMTMCRYFIEFQYSDIFGQAFQQEADLARFFGIYTIVANILALGFQSFITTRMIQNLGVSNANLCYPITSFMAFFGTALSYSLPTGIFARFNQEGLRRAIFHPVNSLFYNAIPPKRRARSIAFNEGIVVPIGSVLAGLTLMLVSGRALSLLALIMTGAWIGISWWQRNIYSRSLVEMLKRSQLEGLTLEEKSIGVLDQHTQVMVIDALKDSQDEVVDVAADLLLLYGRPNARLAVLRQAATGRTTTQMLLMKKLARYPSSDTRNFLLKALDNNDERVKLAALECLIAYPHDEQIRTEVTEFLEYPDIRHQAAAAAAVVRGGDLVQMMKSLIILQKLLFSKLPDEIALGIDALGKTGDERFWVNLRTFLDSDSPDLRLGAMKSMNKMVRIGEIHEHLGILQNLLRDQVRETRTLAIKIISRVRTPHSISLLVDALSDGSPRNRRLAMEGLSFFGSEIISPLLLLLEDPRAAVPAQEAAVRLLNLSQDSEVHERLQRFALDRIKAMYEYKLDERILRTESSPEDTEYLATVLDEKARMLLKLVLAHVAPDQRSSEARQVFKNLYSANQEIMSNAIEVLQSMGERTLIFHILPILEGLPLEQISSYGERTFRLESRNPQMVIGRYLLSLDPHLKEASVYTVGRMRLSELEPAVRKIQNSEKLSPELTNLIEWTLEQMTVRSRPRNLAGEKQP